MDIIYNFWKGGPKQDEKSENKTEPTGASETVAKQPENPELESRPENTDNSNNDGNNAQEKAEKDSVETNSAGIAVDFQEVSHKAMESAKSLGNFLYSVANKAGRTVSETAKQLKHTVEENSMLADFNKEQEEFLKTKNGSTLEPGMLPWVGCMEEDSVKQQILSLSTDKRNFLRNPPSGVQFQFNFDEMYPIALAILNEDKNLQAMRFELVPKLVNEENFWRNYFYRVSLVKQSNQLSSLAQERHSSSCDTSSRSSVDSSSEDSIKAKKTASGDYDDSPLDSPSHEFVSDAYGNSQLSAEDLKQGMKQLGLSERVGNEEAWEKELQQELEDYEVVVSQQEGAPEDPEWENEVEKMLKAENTTK